jgi:hypothetical protein
MVVSPVGFGNKNHCAAEDPQQFSKLVEGLVTPAAFKTTTNPELLCHFVKCSFFTSSLSHASYYSNFSWFSHMKNNFSRPFHHQFHYVASFLKTRLSLSHSRISQYSMDPEVSLPCSQDSPPTGSYLSQINPIDTL